MNTKTPVSFLLSILAWVAFCSAPAYGAVAGEGKFHNELSILKESTVEKSNWKSIINETFGFSFQVPVSSRIDGHRISGESEIIRIQNFQPSDGSGLKPDTYWLEIFIFDHKAKRKVWEPCATLITSPTIEHKDGVKVYQGNPKNVSPDAGGNVRGFCAETDAFDIYMQAAEKNKDTPILNNIYGGFRFTPRAGRR
jgi:hypothetical protein